MDPDELRGLRAFFLDEAEEHLEAIAEAMADLARTPSAHEPLVSLLRKLHTLKGSAGSVLLDDLSRLAHGLEDRVVALRERGRPLHTADLALVEEGLERLRAENRAGGARGAGRRGGAGPGRRHPNNGAQRNSHGAVEGERNDAPTVRVEVERIDELMDAASELVFDRSRVARRLQELEGCVRDVTKVQTALQHVLSEIERVPVEWAARLGEIATETLGRPQLAHPRHGRRRRRRRRTGTHLVDAAGGHPPRPHDVGGTAVPAAGAAGA